MKIRFTKIFIKMLAIFIFITMFAFGETKIVSACNENYVKGKPGLIIKYTGNEGVLITSGKKKVLIDALHREYKPDYLFPPPELLKSMETALSPYDQINLLLVSHMHLDHFHPESVALALKNNPHGVLVSSEQVVSQINENLNDDEKIKSRIIEITPEWKQKSELNIEGIQLTVLGLRHVNRQHIGIQNLGYLIEIGGRKILHTGDADMTAENFTGFNLDKQGIDVAIIPYWYLLSENGRELVKKHLNPNHIIAVHISPNGAEKIVEQIRQFYPDAGIFTKISEEKGFK